MGARRGILDRRNDVAVRIHEAVAEIEHSANLAAGRGWA